MRKTRWNVTETELEQVRELARRGIVVSTLSFGTPCTNSDHAHQYHDAYRPVLGLGPWHETGTGYLCSHNHRSEEAAINCGNRFLKDFGLTPNENWRVK